MYAAHYGLREMPFNLTPDTRFILRTENYLEAMSNLKYGIEQGKGLMILTGEVGTGKTTTLRSAIQSLQRDVLIAYFFNPYLCVPEFFEQLSIGLGLGLPADASKPQMLSALGRSLAMRHTQGLRTALIIDEAHGLSGALLEEIRLLLNFETGSGKLLQVVLCGQPEFRATLDQPGLRQLKQRISLRCTIRPLSPFEVNNYIRFRLKTAGAERVNIFDQEAVTLIGRVSQGIPRLINSICDNALLYGYAAGQDTITRDLIREVVETLELIPAESGQNNYSAEQGDFSRSTGLLT